MATNPSRLWASCFCLCTVPSLVACRDTSTEPSPSLSQPALAARAGPGLAYQATYLGTLGGPFAIATDINNFGTVVGWSQTATGEDHAFRWRPGGGMVDLATLPGHQWSHALSITASGRILGESGPTNGWGTPVVWPAFGPPVILPIPLLDPGLPDAVLLVADMNEPGQVVGSSSSRQHAWIWDRIRGMLDIRPLIPDEGADEGASRVNGWGLVVGTASPGGRYHAFTFSRLTGYRELEIPPHDFYEIEVSYGYGVNNRGQAVGGFVGTPILWPASGGFQLLPMLDPSCRGAATSINSLGVAAGSMYCSGAVGPVVWPPMGGITQLPSDGQASVYGINDEGTAAGWSSRGATVWRLLPRADAAMAVTAAGPVSAPASALGQSSVGPASCLSDTTAMISRAHMFACFAARE